MDIILFVATTFAVRMASHPIKIALGAKSLESGDVLISYIALIASVVVAILALKGKTSAIDLKKSVPAP